MVLKYVARAWIVLVRRYRLRRFFFISRLTDLLIYYRYHGRLPKRGSFLISDIAFWNKADRDAVALGPFTDKELAKYFIAGIVGLDKVPKTLAVLKSVEELRQFNSDVPYIAKPTHTSGGVIPKPSGGPLTSNEVASLKASLDFNYFFLGGEHHYRKLDRKVLIEEFLTSNGTIPPDYKFTYYRGECLYITVDFDRFGDHQRAQYSRYWQRLDMMWDIPSMAADVPRPRQLDEILAVTQKIAKLFDFCRVDCYVFNDRYYIGELTFDPNNAMMPFMPPETGDVRHHLARDERMRQALEEQARQMRENRFEPARDYASLSRR